MTFVSYLQVCPDTLPALYDQMSIEDQYALSWCTEPIPGEMISVLVPCRMQFPLQLHAPPSFMHKSLKNEGFRKNPGTITHRYFCE